MLSLRLFKSGRQDDYQTAALFQLNRRVKCGLGHGVLRILGLVWRLRPILLPPLFRCFSWSGQPLCLPEARGGGVSNFVSISLLFLGACLLVCACCPVDAPDLAFCSVTLRVFDKLSWTLCVVECQFVKYPKCGSCLASPGPGQSK